MIFDWLLSIPAYLLEGIIGLLPAGGTMPTEWVQGVYTVWGDMNAFSFIVPVNTLISVLALALTFHIAVFTFKAVHWIITKIPFIG